MTVKRATKPIKVTVNIKPAKPSEVTTHQRQLYNRFWQRLISQVKAESEAAK